MASRGLEDALPPAVGAEGGEAHTEAGGFGPEVQRQLPGCMSLSSLQRINRHHLLSGGGWEETVPPSPHSQRGDVATRGAALRAPQALLPSVGRSAHRTTPAIGDWRTFRSRPSRKSAPCTRLATRTFTKAFGLLPC